MSNIPCSSTQNQTANNSPLIVLLVRTLLRKKYFKALANQLQKVVYKVTMAPYLLMVKLDLGRHTPCLDLPSNSLTKTRDSYPGPLTICFSWHSTKNNWKERTSSFCANAPS